jgi:hypothetical protein
VTGSTSSFGEKLREQYADRTQVRDRSRGSRRLLAATWDMVFKPLLQATRLVGERRKKCPRDRRTAGNVDPIQGLSIKP